MNINDILKDKNKKILFNLSQLFLILRILINTLKNGKPSLKHLCKKSKEIQNGRMLIFE